MFEAEVVSAPPDMQEQWAQGARVVVKYSWMPTDRKTENEIIDLALNMAHGDHAWVRDHLPCPLYTDELKNPKQPVEYLSETYHDKKSPTKFYEKRVLRLTVFEKLEPLANVDNAYDFAHITRHIFACEHNRRCL